MKRLFLFCIVTLLLQPIGGMAKPQAGQGEVKGRVTDGQGKPVAGVTVVFRNVLSGREYQATTDQNGEYMLTGLEPGRYALQTQTGQTTTGNQINVDVAGTAVTIVQDTSGQLEVRAETQIEDRSTANIKNAYDDLQIELLPQPNQITKDGRFYGAYNLSLLSEGVTAGSVFQNGVGPSVGGRPNTSNNYHVNGTDNNNQAVPGPLVTVTNEATTDFTLMQGQQFPQFGHSTGGQMNSILADGGNQWHGGVYDYFNNRKLNGVEPVLTGQPVNRYDQHRIGGKAGGPLKTNHVFAFGDFEFIPLRARQPFLNPAFAPTAAGFAALAAIPGVSTTNLGVLRNNLQVSQTPIATTTVNGVGIPLGLVNSGVTAHQDQFNGIANIDWNMSGKSALGVRYVHNDVGTDTFGGNLPSFRVPGHTRSLLGVVNYTSTPWTSLTFNVNAGYNRLDQKIGGGSFTFPGLAAFPNITIQELGCRWDRLWRLAVPVRTCTRKAGPPIGELRRTTSGSEWTCAHCARLLEILEPRQALSVSRASSGSCSIFRLTPEVCRPSAGFRLSETGRSYIHSFRTRSASTASTWNWESATNTRASPKVSEDKQCWPA